MTATTSRILLGMLTPSSNTVLEPVTAALLAGIPEASAHFGRFRVTEIALSQSALAQFDDTEILAAARLLSHARCQVIAWNGTAAGWRGFHMDETLCAAITRETGAMAATSVLALNEILAITGVKRLGIVSPYTDDVQAAIARNYESIGIAVTGEVHEGLADNYSFSEITADRMRAMAREVAKAKPEAIAIYCTNMRGAPLAESLEAELGIPVYDTVSTVLWKSLKLTGVDTRRITGWGSLFREV
jgi:maleate isomerase